MHHPYKNFCYLCDVNTNNRINIGDNNMKLTNPNASQIEMLHAMGVLRLKRNCTNLNKHFLSFLHTGHKKSWINFGKTVH